MGQKVNPNSLRVGKTSIGNQLGLKKKITLIFLKKIIIFEAILKKTMLLLV